MDVHYISIPKKSILDLSNIEPRDRVKVIIKLIAKNPRNIKKEEDYNLVYMQDIKEVSHADLYKSSFSLVIHIKSFTKPY